MESLPNSPRQDHSHFHFFDHAVEPLPHEILTRHELSVFPVPAPVPGARQGVPGDGKTPAIPWRPYQTRRPSADELHAWFVASRQNNIAVVCGLVSNVVVVDCDSADALAWARRALPWTPWRVITARGEHWYYQSPDVPVRNRARVRTAVGQLSLDVRGDGGYVVGAGSRHATGALYEFDGDWTVEKLDLPTFELSWLEPARPAPTLPAVRSTPTNIASVSERARRYLDAVPVPEIGCGSDHSVFVAACRLTRGFGLAADEAGALLWSWCGGRPGWTRAWVDGKVAAASRYGQEPVGGLL